MRAALSVLLSLSVAVVLVLGAQADDKSKEVKLEGKICCAKCELKEAAKCATVISVKEGGKDVVYYFDAKSDKANHKKICTESKEGTVTGTVAEKDGKKVVTVKKVDFK